MRVYSASEAQHGISKVSASGLTGSQEGAPGSGSVIPAAHVGRNRGAPGAGGGAGSRSASAARPLCPPLGGASPDGADSATRGGSFVPPRTPFLSPSAATEPLSAFRRSGCEGAGPTAQPAKRCAVPAPA